MRQIKPDIFEVGAIDWDRRLFDEIIPLPDGTSYNAYLVKGSEKTALLDTVDPPKWETLLANLTEMGVKKLDYVISHHAEQDHSGSLPNVLQLFPDAKLVTNAKCKGMLIDLHEIAEDRFMVIEDGQEISLGNKTLKFLLTPWVHWPETMCTYLAEDKILFSCDFFGSHLATSDLFATDMAKVMECNKRYYAEIMMPFRNIIVKNIAKIEAYNIEIIAPSHGPLYNKPQIVIDAYKEWINEDKVENKVIVAYASMHGSTRKMIDHLVKALMNRGVGVQQFDLVTADIGKLAVETVDAAGIVLASPTFLTGLHPAAAYAAFLVNALRPKTKYLAFVGSFGWAGRIVDQVKQMLSNSKAELFEPLLIKGLPKNEDFKKLDELAEKISNKHKELIRT
ncbi:MAG: MBL fold hydrolase [Planctomycetes bacterium GWF2_42_9]|nr:MAG: MBL fold hydrolase [Planctomycetes bacterium GWF2_42_9]HAL46113.1 MBL fold hydrolase [Phycisphaerales bacterium]